MYQLPSRENWVDKITAGGKYFVTRNGSSIIAFAVGKAYKPGNGVAMVAGHIDALTARLKPVSTRPNSYGYVQLGVAQYAGALNETWWDRDLSVGGRVIVQDPVTKKTTVKLVKLDWPSMYIPLPYGTLCARQLIASNQLLVSRHWLPTSASE